MMSDIIDPNQRLDLAQIKTVYQKRFQLQVEYVKEKVGEGVEYKNDVVRVVVSDTGAYYELVDLPEDFSGGVSDRIERHFLSQAEAIAQLEKVYAAAFKATPQNTQHFTLFALYTRSGLVDRKNCFLMEYHPQRDGGKLPPITVGKFQPGVMPLFYKIKLEADYTQEVLQIERGVVFCIANAGDRHLLVRIPYDGPKVTDLGALPDPKIVQ